MVMTEKNKNQSDTPPYPNWKKGFSWGLVWGLIGGIIFFVMAGLAQIIPSIGYHDFFSMKHLKNASIFGLIGFLVCLTVFGIVISFRPEIKQRSVIFLIKKVMKRKYILPCLTYLTVLFFIYLFAGIFAGGREMNPEFYALYFKGFILAMSGLLVGIGSVFTAIGLYFNLSKPFKKAFFYSGYAGLVTYIVFFSITFFFASIPGISPVSLCYTLRPWWKAQNWVMQLFPSIFVIWIFFHTAIASEPMEFNIKYPDKRSKTESEDK